jgi:hypothetical protein
MVSIAVYYFIVILLATLLRESLTRIGWGPQLAVVLAFYCVLHRARAVYVDADCGCMWKLGVFHDHAIIVVDSQVDEVRDGRI